MSPAAIYTLVAVGCVAAGALVWHAWFPIEIRRILGAKPPEWPRRNEGGGWEQRDGRITKDRDGAGPDLRKQR